MAQPDNQVIEVIPTLLVGDNSFGPDAIPFCTLCVEIDERRIRFCIVRDEKMECVWLEDYNFDAVLDQGEIFERLKKIFTGHLLWSSSSWKSVRISINSLAFSLIPKIIFDADSAPSYLEFALGRPIQPDEKVLYHEISLIHGINVFTIPKLWYDWIVTHFEPSNIAFYHLTSPLVIGAMVSHAEYQELKVVSIYFEKDYFTLIVTNAEQLILCNRYKFAQPQELAYIVLFALNELNLLPESVKLICYGEVSPTADSYAELARFFPDILIGTGPTTLRYSRHCGDLPGHRYFGLFNTYLVEV